MKMNSIFSKHLLTSYSWAGTLANTLRYVLIKEAIPASKNSHCLEEDRWNKHLYSGIHTQAYLNAGGYGVPGLIPLSLSILPLVFHGLIDFFSLSISFLLDILPIHPVLSCTLCPGPSPILFHALSFAQNKNVSMTCAY